MYRPKVVAEFGRHRLMVRFGRYTFGTRRIGRDGSVAFGAGVLCGSWARRTASCPPRWSLRVEGRRPTGSDAS